MLLPLALAFLTGTLGIKCILLSLGIIKIWIIFNFLFLQQNIIISKLLILLLFLLLGLIWAMLHLSWYKNSQLPIEHYNKWLQVNGTIEDIIFLGKSNKIKCRIIIHDPLFPQKLFVQLSWFRPPNNINIGETWNFFVKLKPPHNLSNPGSFQQKKYFLINRLHAYGYIKSGQKLNIGLLLC